MQARGRGGKVLSVGSDALGLEFEDDPHLAGLAIGILLHPQVFLRKAVNVLVGSLTTGDIEKTIPSPSEEEGKPR